MKKETRSSKRLVRAKRIRARVFGTESKPRVSVFRSLRSFYAQIINDVDGRTIFHVSTFGLGEGNNNVAGVEKLGSALAEKCLSSNISEVVFDRSGYKYHGKVKAFAEALRSGGLKF